MPADREDVESVIRASCQERNWERATTLVLEHYGREILGFLIARLRDPDLAGEIFSQFTEDLWRGLPSFEFRCSARTWAYSLVRHAASHHIKAARRDAGRLIPISEAGAIRELEHKVRTETIAAARTEVKQRITELRERLPPDDQAVLVLRVSRKLDWKEIAHVLLYEGEGRPVPAEAIRREAARVRKRFQLVKERLREMAQAEGLLDAEPG
jgi:RNA polymerase sigma-70 factor (ECF subfamily)